MAAVAAAMGATFAVFSETWAPPSLATAQESGATSDHLRKQYWKKDKATQSLSLLLN